MTGTVSGPRRILVTGGAGFIGSHFVRTLVAGGADGRRPMGDGATIVVLDTLTYAGNLLNLRDCDGGYTFVRGDICDRALLADVVPGCDMVVNFAAESHVDRAIDDADRFVRSNVLGVDALMRACLNAGVPRVIQVSTDEVYGSIDQGSWTEAAPPSPNSPYAASKAGGDMIALAYARTHGLPVVVTRCSNNYGPYQFPEKLIPKFITRLLRGQSVPLYGDGGNVRDWIHVTDHCRGIQVAAERGRPGEVYHIAGTAELTNLQLVRHLLDRFGLDAGMVDHVPDRKGHDRRYSLCDAKLRDLGYAPTVAFPDGIAETVEWYAANRAWWESAECESATAR